jgi:hypothetical protein
VGDGRTVVLDRDFVNRFFLQSTSTRRLIKHLSSGRYSVGQYHRAPTTRSRVRAAVSQRRVFLGGAHGEFLGGGVPLHRTWGRQGQVTSSECQRAPRILISRLTRF